MEKGYGGGNHNITVSFEHNDLWHWLYQKAAANRRKIRDEIIILLEQLKRDEEAAAGDKPAS
jgi:hypothetical protein